jgi:hypothetical protein
MTSPSSVIPRGVGDRVLAVPPHLRRPNGRPRWSMTVTGRRGSEGVTLVIASRSRRLASGAAGADRFFGRFGDVGSEADQSVGDIDGCRSEVRRAPRGSTYGGCARSAGPARVESSKAFRHDEESMGLDVQAARVAQVFMHATQWSVVELGAEAGDLPSDQAQVVDHGADVAEREERSLFAGVGRPQSGCGQGFDGRTSPGCSCGPLHWGGPTRLAASRSARICPNRSRLRREPTRATTRTPTTAPGSTCASCGDPPATRTHRRHRHPTTRRSHPFERCEAVSSCPLGDPALARVAEVVELRHRTGKTVAAS